MAPDSTGERDTAPRLSWSPPHGPQHNGNDDDTNHTEQLNSAYINDRFQPPRTIYPDTPEMESSSKGQPPRKKRHIDTSDVDSLNQDEQSTKGPYFDAIRNTFTSSQNTAVALSQETLRTLDSRPGEPSGRVQGWLQGPTQFSVDTQRRNKHSVEYLLQEDQLQRTRPVPKSAIPQRRTEQHECVNCKRAFNTKSELRHHARRYEKRPYNCDQCEKSFLYPKDLRRHATTHTGSKQYHCLSCPKAFSRKDNLRRHMSNEHGNEEGSYEEMINQPSGRRDREPDEDSEDHFDNQPRQQQANNDLAHGTGQEGAPQPESEEQSGSGSGQQKIQQSGNGSEGRSNQEQQDILPNDMDVDQTQDAALPEPLTDGTTISSGSYGSYKLSKQVSQSPWQTEWWRKDNLQLKHEGRRSAMEEIKPTGDSRELVA